MWPFTAKKLFGYFCLSLPFIAVAIISLYLTGIMGFLITFGSAALIIWLIKIGVDLTSD